MNRGNIMDQIAILIPCYNEEQTIGKVIDDCHQYLPEAVVYVYNNNSSDKTVEVALAHNAIVRNEKIQGKGNVIRRMFREIDAKCYLMIDGDDTYPLEYAKEMTEKVILNKTDMVIGDRLSSTYFTENKRPFHNFGNTLVRSCINHLFHTKIKDIMTGYRAFSYQFVKTFPVLSTGFEIETEMIIHAISNNLQIENVIVEYRDRPNGSVSKLNTYSDGLRVLNTILRLYKNYKPFRFFTTISVVLLLLAIIFFVPILITFFHTHLVPNFPTLIVCGFAVIASLQSFFTGLILNNMCENNRRRFEMDLLQVYREL